MPAARPKPRTSRAYAKRAVGGLYNAVAILSIHPNEDDPHPLPHFGGLQPAPPGPSSPTVTYVFPTHHAETMSVVSNDSDDEFDPRMHYDEQPDLYALFEVADPARDPPDDVEGGPSVAQSVQPGALPTTGARLAEIEVGGLLVPSGQP